MGSRLEAIGKSLLTAPLYFWPTGLPPPVPPPAGAIRRVLLVRPDERIGNLILLTPLIDAIHRAWPGVTIDLLVGGAMVDLMAADPRLRACLVFDKRGLVRNPLGLLPLAEALRRGNYDLAIDASHPHTFSLTPALAVWASGARWRLGYLDGPAHRLVNVGLRLDPDARDHLTDVYLNLLRLLAPEAENRGLNLPVGSAERAEAGRRLAAVGVRVKRGVRVGVHPGGRGAKRWPIASFIDVMRALGSDPAVQPLVFQGPGEEELVADIPPAVARVVPRLPLRLFAAALAHCDLVISGDTGPMHLAAAVQTPTLALFLQGNHGVFGPRGTRHRILYRPAGPSPAEVVAAAREMLAAGSETPRVS